MADTKLDLKLIPKFDSSMSEKVELTFCLCRLKQVKQVIPLQQTGGALNIYQQLSNNKKANVGLTKAALYKAFTMDP